jgi:hypothetical protein
LKVSTAITRHPKCPFFAARWIAATANGFEQGSQKGNLFMNKDVLEGIWKQIRGEVKKWWGKITDEDLDRIAGN